MTALCCAAVLGFKPSLLPAADRAGRRTRRASLVRSGSAARRGPPDSRRAVSARGPISAFSGARMQQTRSPRSRRRSPKWSARPPRIFSVAISATWRNISNANPTGHSAAPSPSARHSAASRYFGRCRGRGRRPGRSRRPAGLRSRTPFRRLSRLRRDPYRTARRRRTARILGSRRRRKRGFRSRLARSNVVQLRFPEPARTPDSMEQLPPPDVARVDERSLVPRRAGRFPRDCRCSEGRGRGARRDRRWTEVTSAAGPAEGPRAEAASDRPAPGHSDLSRNAAAIFDRLGIGLLVSRDNVAIYANRTLLDLLGFADEDALHAAGGMSQIYRTCTGSRQRNHRHAHGVRRISSPSGRGSNRSNGTICLRRC